MLGTKLSAASLLLFSFAFPSALAWMHVLALCRRAALRCATSGRRYPNEGIRSLYSVTLPSSDQRLSVSGLSAVSPDRLDAIESEIFDLHGSSFNLNSPQQVSTAIFGNVQSTAKSELERLLRDEPSDSRQSRLATLILEHRSLVKRIKDEEADVMKATIRLAEETVGGPRARDQLSKSDSLEAKTEHTKTESPSTSPRAPSYHMNDPDAYEDQVKALFDQSSRINSYWEESLLQLARPSARSLVPQLDASICPMGFDPNASPIELNRSSEARAPTTAGKKGTFLAYCREQKERYADCVILTRCGDFYEAFGVDALLMVEHCGLNAMAGKAKAGCPYRNVQATIDGLCDAGFKVAVFEEAGDTTGKARIKTRFLAQIVSSASPTYLYDLVLSSHADSLAGTSTSRPFVGVVAQKAGYTLVEVGLDEQTVRVTERLTSEGVACRLAAYPPADPLIYVPTTTEYKRYKTSNSLRLPFLPSSKDARASLGGGRLRTKLIPPMIVQQAGGLTEVKRIKRLVVLEVLRMNGGTDDDGPKWSPDDFVAVSNSKSGSSSLIQTNPLHLETATQLGLMNDPSIPSLVSCLLPNSAPASTRNFLRRHLLHPPPPPVSEAMRTLISYLRNSERSLPPLSIPPVGNVLALLRAGQASAQVYGEIMGALDTMSTLLRGRGDPQFVDPLLTILQYESGMSTTSEILCRRCEEVKLLVEEVVSPVHHVAPSKTIDQISSFGGLIPPAFFERNEANWRGRVRRQAIPEAYDLVQSAATKLADAVARDFWLLESREENVSERSSIVQDIFNNLIAIKEVPSAVEDSSRYIHPRDRTGKILRNRFTTEAVQIALSEYVGACERACRDVADALVTLSHRLIDEGHVPAIVQASHANLILCTCFYHSVQANGAGWSTASVHDGDWDDDTVGYFDGVWPYWMDRSQAVTNSFNLDGMWLLTAPNMSGKSTVMRSTAAAALLSVCGLCAPLGPDSKLRRFDHIFVRGASSDVPAEKKSAFGAEMEDISALLRSCGKQSLVFVDELGRGTSPRDGTRLAAAVLESMAVNGMSGIFATHLHDILMLPLNASDRIPHKRMVIRQRGEAEKASSKYKWTYLLEDGVCTDSLALVTAARFGLPREVILRAEALDEYIPSLGVTESSSPHESFAGFKDAKPKEFGVEEISEIVRETTGGDPLLVLPKWIPPAALDGKACMYVIRLPENRYYVGETGDFRQRIAQHRAKPGSWKDLLAIVVPCGNKTQARAWESLTIQELAGRGAEMVSTSDGRSLQTSADQRKFNKRA